MMAIPTAGNSDADGEMFGTAPCTCCFIRHLSAWVSYKVVHAARSRATKALALPPSLRPFPNIYSGCPKLGPGKTTGSSIARMPRAECPKLYISHLIAQRLV